MRATLLRQTKDAMAWWVQRFEREGGREREREAVLLGVGRVAMARMGERGVVVCGAESDKMGEVMVGGLCERGLWQ